MAVYLTLTISALFKCLGNIDFPFDSIHSITKDDIPLIHATLQ